eukprot:scaffold130311_cov32-Tisochrysis_lutea.AAC.3
MTRRKHKPRNPSVTPPSTWVTERIDGGDGKGGLHPDDGKRCARAGHRRFASVDVGIDLVVARDRLGEGALNHPDLPTLRGAAAPTTVTANAAPYTRYRAWLGFGVTRQD